MRTYHVLIGFAITAILFALFLNIPPFAEKAAALRFTSLATLCSVMAIGSWIGWLNREFGVISPLLLIRPLLRLLIFLAIVGLIINVFIEADQGIRIIKGIIAFSSMFIFLFCAGLSGQGLLRLFFPKLSRYIIVDS